MVLDFKIPQKSEKKNLNKKQTVETEFERKFKY